MISTKLLSTWFDQTNCVSANEMRLRVGGSTSKVSRNQPSFEQPKGTITAVTGRIRPIMAFRSDSEGRDRGERMDGVPIAPQATGAVFAIKSTQRMKRFETKSDHEAQRWQPERRIRCASINAPKQNATSRTCKRRSAVMPGNRFFHVRSAGPNVCSGNPSCRMPSLIRSRCISTAK